MRLRYTVDDIECVAALEGGSGREVRLGRGSGCDIVLPDFSVSRSHAVLRHDGESWYVLDQESTNGVIVNGVRLQEAKLAVGDQLKIGTFVLSLENLPSEAIQNAAIVRAFDDFQNGIEFEGVAEGEERPTPAVTVLTDTGSRAVGSLRVTVPGGDRRKLVSALHRLGRELLDTDEVDEVLERVMEAAFNALGINRGFILLGTAEDAFCALARSGEQVTVRPEQDVPVSSTILETVMREQVALLTLDAGDDERLKGGESIRLHGIGAAMCAPLWSEERISGFIQVDSPIRLNHFDDEGLDFLIALANYAAIAVERVHARRARRRLERYHSPAVVKEVLDNEDLDANTPRIRRAEVTVLFGDLVGFTAFSESASPEQVAELLEGYCTRTVDAIFDHGGTLDKFIGDCVMAFFGAPVAFEDHAERAVSAATAIQDAIAQWSQERQREGLPPVSCRIGLNSGLVVVGDVGSDSRVDYTVLGNTVNVAARLESNVAQPGWVVVGGETRRRLGESFRLEALGEFALKGLQQRVEAFRVLAQEPAVLDDSSSRSGPVLLAGGEEPN